MSIADLLYKVWAAIYNNKQTILASLMAALSYIQASADLPNLIEPQTYRWAMMVAGLLMVLFARSASGGAVASKVLPQSIPSEKP